MSEEMSYKSENDSEITGSESDFSDSMSEDSSENSDLERFKPRNCKIKDVFLQDDFLQAKTEDLSEENFSVTESESETDDSDDEDEIEKGRQTQNNDGWVDITTKPIDFPISSLDCAINSITDIEKIRSFFAIHKITPLGSFNYFVNDEIIDIIVKQTNAYVAQKLKDGPSEMLENWSDTDSNEIKQFLAVVISMQLVAMPDLDSYWTDHPLFRPRIVSSLMCGNRFHQLINFIHFESGERLDETKPRDRITKFNSLISKLVDEYQIMKPGKDLIIYEDVFSLNPTYRIKSLKDTVRCRRVCDKNGYTFNLNLYPGKSGTFKNLENSRKVIKKILNFVEPKEGRIVYTDANNTDEQLVRELYEMKMYVCGQLNYNKMTPGYFYKNLKYREILGKEKDKVKVIKFADKFPYESVLLMTSHPEHGTDLIPTKRNKNSAKFAMKPKCLIDFDDARREVDKIREKINVIDTTFINIKWFRKILIDLITGTSLINSYVLYNLVAEKKLDFIEYRMKLVKELGSNPKECNCEAAN